MKRYIKASFMSEYKDNYAIPEPFNTWYKCGSDEEVNRLIDYPVGVYPCESIPGYDCKHICWAIGKTEDISKELANNGMEAVELITEGDSKPFLAYCDDEFVYSLSLTDIPSKLKDVEGSTSINAASGNNYDHTVDFYHGRKHFFIKYSVDEDHNWITKAQITSIHPYDDADYAWAKIDGPQVQFIRDGKVLTKMTLPDYDEDLYETGFDGYLDDMFDSIVCELIDLDRDTKPIMVHN